MPASGPAAHLEGGPRLDLQAHVVLDGLVRRNDAGRPRLVGHLSPTPPGGAPGARTLLTGEGTDGLVGSSRSPTSWTRTLVAGVELVRDAASCRRRSAIERRPERTLDRRSLLSTTRTAGTSARWPPWSTSPTGSPRSSEVARITSMMENCPTNMMFADRDFTITYMNPASLETLSGLEEHLPVKAATTSSGSSLDIFHRNPRTSAGSWPTRACCRVGPTSRSGPETLDLLVSAIRDEQRRLHRRDGDLGGRHRPAPDGAGEGGA